MNKIVEESLKHLPLVINSIEWNDPNLILIGENWSFSSFGSWRIINNNQMLCGCFDKNANDILCKTKGEKIISIEIQSPYLQVDPVFLFSNGYRLEIFSSTYFEPWIFDFSSGTVYIASPSDKNG